MKYLSASLLPLIATFGTFAMSGARAEVTHIDNEELARLMAAGVSVIDIRTEPEWKETGIVKGSRLMTFFDERGRADPQRWLALLSPVAKADQPVILICRTGNRTGVLAKFLDEKVGYTKVYNVKHGIYGWMKERRSVEPAAQTLAACKSAGSC